MLCWKARKWGLSKYVFSHTKSARPEASILFHCHCGKNWSALKSTAAYLIMACLRVAPVNLLWDSWLENIRIGYSHQGGDDRELVRHFSEECQRFQLPQLHRLVLEDNHHVLSEEVEYNVIIKGMTAILTKKDRYIWILHFALGLTIHDVVKS